MGRVMHKRIFPRQNFFQYGIYYLALPLNQINTIKNNWLFGINKPAILSFYNRDHGARDGQSLQSWINTILQEANLQDAAENITLICMPRVFGYVFNPVSFWLCRDKNENLRAVLCEVNNTFGETHSYLCAPTQGETINNEEWLEAEKLFHVSPFLEREGRYKFRFNIHESALNIAIDFHDKSGNKKLVTTLTGKLVPLNAKNLKQAFWKHPLVTMTAVIRIHWQAIKLVLKGIKYRPKPKQLDIKQSHNVTKV